MNCSQNEDGGSNTSTLSLTAFHSTTTAAPASAPSYNQSPQWQLGADPLVFEDGISTCLVFVASQNVNFMTSVSGSGVVRVCNCTATTTAADEHFGKWELLTQKDDDPSAFGFKCEKPSVATTGNGSTVLMFHPFLRNTAAVCATTMGNANGHAISRTQTFGAETYKPPTDPNDSKEHAGLIVDSPMSKASVAISENGQRLAMTVVVNNVQEPGVFQRGVRAHERIKNTTTADNNGFFYQQMGDTLILDTATTRLYSGLFMNAAGDTILVGLNEGDDWDMSVVFQCDNSQGQWLRDPIQAPPFGYLAPSGMRVAILDGLSILHLMANEEGRPALHRYQRVTTVQPSHQKRPGDDDATSTAIKIGSGGDSSLPSIPKLEEIRQGLGASDSISWRLKGLVSVRHLVIVLLLMA